MYMPRVHPVSVRMQQELNRRRTESDGDFGAAISGAAMAQPFDDVKFNSDMAEFERQMAANEKVTVYERIERPTVVPADAIDPADVELALQGLIDCFIAHNICIDFFGEYTPMEMYRAIVDDLFPEEIMVLTAGGWVSHIPHITPENQIRHDIEWFVSTVLLKDREALIGERSLHSPRRGYNGLIQTPEAFARDLAELWSRLGDITHVDVNVTGIDFHGGRAQAIATIHWHTKAVGGCGLLESTFNLEQMPDVCWDVVETSFVTDMLRYL